MTAADSSGSATPPAFEALCTAGATRLIRQVYLLTGSRHRAAHCVHRALELAWDDWEEVSADPSPEGWVRVTAFELALSPWHWNGLDRFQRPVPARPEKDRGLTPQDHVLLRALLRLPRSQRRALVLHDVIGLDWKQTSTEVESTTPAAYGRVVRARRALAEAAPSIVGGDPQAPGFGRHLGVRLWAAAERACPAAAGRTVQARQVQRRSRVRERGVTTGAGLLTLAAVGGLTAALARGTPLHPPAPAFVTYQGNPVKHGQQHQQAQTRPQARPQTRPLAQAAVPADQPDTADAAATAAAPPLFPALFAVPGRPAQQGAAARPDLAADVTGLPNGFCSLFALPCAHHHPGSAAGAGPHENAVAPHRSDPVRGDWSDLLKISR